MTVPLPYQIGQTVLGDPGGTSGNGGIGGIVGNPQTGRGGDVYLKAGRGSIAPGATKIVDPVTNNELRFDTAALTAQRNFSFPDSSGKVVLDSTIQTHLSNFVTRDEMNAMIATIRPAGPINI